MGARQTMRMRCTLERNVETSDGGGGTTQSWVTSYTGLACRWWAEQGDEVVAGGQVVRRNRDCLIVPLGTNVTPRDRVAVITDRRGLVIVSGPVWIDAIDRRRDHLELKLSERRTDG
jgi:head-tail adaptor